MKEEKIDFDSGKAFYNPNMQFNRSFSSLAVGALGEKLKVLDAFCASGIRGLRYAKENKNVTSIAFLDMDKKAIRLAKKNASKNKVKAGFIALPMDKFIVNDGKYEFNFIEIDPFGSPVPYLTHAIRHLARIKCSYLSVTATDVAVLCGPGAKAALKNYHSKSLNNEFTHEVGTRILIKRVIEAAGEFNLGVTPLFSLSDRHYIKLFFRLEKSAEKADENWKDIGYVSYCNFCGWRKSGKRINSKCEHCSKENDYAGPLWLGELHDRKFLLKMIGLNDKRGYKHGEEIAKTLGTMVEEAQMPPFYYDVHWLGKRLHTPGSPKMGDIISDLRKRGFAATRTHFDEVGLKTNAALRELEIILKHR